MIVADHGTCSTFGGGVRVAPPLTPSIDLNSLKCLGRLSRAYLLLFRYPRCCEQEGADVCQECDAAKPYTGSVQTTTAAGCWDEDFRSDIDMVIGGT